MKMTFQVVLYPKSLSDGGSCSWAYDDLDAFIKNEIEAEKSISVIE